MARNLQEGRHNASMSKTDLLFRCQWWAQPAVTLPLDKDIKELDDAPRFGIAFHKGVELWLKGESVSFKAVAEEHAVDEARLENFLKRAFDYIPKLLKSRGWANRERLIETKVAYDPFQDRMRVLKSSKTRDYSKCGPTEIPGTLDFGLLPRHSKEELVLIDWKTGVTSYDADLNRQLRSLSLALTAPEYDEHGPTGLPQLGVRRVRVFIVRLDDEWEEESESVLGPKRLEQHRKKLCRKLIAARRLAVGMFPGSHCKNLYCNANGLCPASRDPMFVGDLGPPYDGDVFRLQYNAMRAGERYLEMKKEELKTALASIGPVQNDDGKWLMLVDKSKKNLSQASIFRAMGRVRGQEVIDMLEKEGAIEEPSWQEINSRVEPVVSKKRVK